MFSRALLIGLGVVGVAFASAPTSPALELATRIALPAVSGRIDHLAIDPAGQRLFIAALGHDSLEVVDLASGRPMRSIPGFSEPQGLAYAPELNRLFVANGGDGTVRVLNAAYYGELASIPLGDDADNLRYDEPSHRLYAGYGQGGLAVVDVTTNRIVGRTDLPSHPESFQLEPDGPRAFVNLPGSRGVAVIDRTTRKLIAQWPLDAAGGNFPLAIDAAGRRLFIGCRSPATLVVLDTTAGRELGRTALHGDCDDVSFDAARQRIYASCGEGFVDVYDASAVPRRIATVATVRGARTSLFDRDRLYLAVPRHGDTPAEIRVYAAP